GASPIPPPTPRRGKLSPHSFYIVAWFPSGAFPRPPFLKVNGEPHREPGQRHRQHRPAGRHPPAVRGEPKPLPSHLAQRPTLPSGHQRDRLGDGKPKGDQHHPKWPPTAKPPRVTLGHRRPPP